jgi:hypothetical protein
MNSAIRRFIKIDPASLTIGYIHLDFLLEAVSAIKIPGGYA